MPVTWEGGNTISSALGGDLTLATTLPAGVEEGDVLVVATMWAQSGTSDGPFFDVGTFSGYTFTERYHLDGSGYNPELWIHTTVLDGTEDGATITGEMPSSTSWCFGVSVIRGAINDGTDPFDTISAATRTSGTSVTYPAVTPSVSDHIILAWLTAVPPQDGGSGFPVPTDFTEGYDGGFANQFRNQGMSYREDHTGTSSYTPSGVTLTDSGTFTAMTLSMPVGSALVEGAASLASTTVLASPGGVRTREGAASLATSTALEATGERQTFGAASMATAASVAASGEHTGVGDADLATSTSLAASGVRTVFGAASVVVGSALAASGYTSREGTASIETDVSLDADGEFTSYGSASLTTDVGLAADGDTGITASADLETTVSLDGGTGVRHRFGAAAIAVAADLAGADGVVSRFGDADLQSGEATLAASGVVTQTVEGTADIAVSGALEADGTVTKVVSGTADLQVRSRLDAEGAVTLFHRGSASLAVAVETDGGAGGWIKTTQSASFAVHTYISRAYPKTTRITRMDSLVLSRSRPKPGRYTRRRR